jgi:N-methylhydantoinase B
LAGADAAILRNALEYTSEEMAVALRRSAFSPNIRERADHSCAVLDRRGRIIGQAEQIPVHIGSLPFGLRRTLEYLKNEGIETHRGDMYVVNDPYISGTHLNDITVVRPVVRRGELLGYLANKAHHVDIGGMVPASISPRATELYQEGMVIEPSKLMESDKVVPEVLQFMRARTRLPEYLVGDLNAQIAANLLGERRFLEIVEKQGDQFDEIVEAIIRQTRGAALAEFGELPHGTWTGEDFLEFGGRLLRIRAAVTLSGKGIAADFSGTSPQVSAPLNAVLGVTIAAVSFAAKTIISSDVPLNDGFNGTVKVKAEEGSLVNPRRPAPVAAGNLETSQRIVDVIYRALAKTVPERVPAASHGSMNNLMMGGVLRGSGRPWAFYETIGGGYGGRTGMDGVDGVQVNMTNTLNTPIEVMERYYPLRFTSYRLRDRTGGRGRWRGGAGIERAFVVTDVVSVSVLGERSRVHPWGAQGGMQGQTSEYLVRERGGRTSRLASKAEVTLHPGDELVIRTAGGGGYGKAKRKSSGVRRR